MQLRSRTEITSKFVFHPQGLHTVFAFQHATGKYIYRSNLDQALVDCPVAVTQILRGMHMKIVMEGYQIFYLALNCTFSKSFSKVIQVFLKTSRN